MTTRCWLLWSLMSLSHTYRNSGPITHIHVCKASSHATFLEWWPTTIKTVARFYWAEAKKVTHLWTSCLKFWKRAFIQFTPLLEFVSAELRIVRFCIWLWHHQTPAKSSESVFCSALSFIFPVSVIHANFFRRLRSRKFTHTLLHEWLVRRKTPQTDDEWTRTPQSMNVCKKSGARLNEENGN